MQYSFELNDDPQDESQASSIASDRLRKAIERNRAKQAAREAREAAPGRNPGENLNARMSAQTARGPRDYQRDQSRDQQRESSVRETDPRDSMRASAGRWRDTIEVGKTQARAQESNQEVPNWTPPRSRATNAQTYQSNYSSQHQGTGSAQSQTGASRRSVGKAEDLEFTTNFRSQSKNLPVPVTYQTKPEVKDAKTSTTAKSRKRTAKASTKAKAAPEKITWPIKAAWVFYGVLILRLIFSEGGVIDFYSQNSFYQGKEAVLAEIKTENRELYQEIQRIQTDEIYQKKLVRDHLGFIADDEFLVMFSNREVAASN